MSAPVFATGLGRTWGLVALLAISGTRPLHGQCPDGTPPPCPGAAAVPARRPTPPPAERARHLLLLPFRNVTRDDAHEWMVHGAQVMLADALGRWRDVTVVPDEQLTAVLRRRRLAPQTAPDADQLQGVAQETGGWTAVTGDVIAAGGAIRISARAMDIPSRRVVARGEEQVAGGEDVREAFDRLALRLLRAAGLEARPADVASRPTHSLDAYRAYVRGLNLTRQSAFPRAREAFREAVRLDSGFAQAWARLAYASAIWNGHVLLDPRSDAYRHAERAAALAAQLPERDRQLVQAIADGFRGQFTRSRSVLEGRVRADSNDLDALELLSLVELIDPMLDTTTTPATLRGSLNRATALARRVLELDPERRHVHAVFLYAYGTAAGVWGGALWGFRTEATSLAAHFLRRPDEVFIPVLRDSFVLVPRDTFLAAPPAERDRLRRRAADAAGTWVERWLNADPSDAEAHFWASRIAERQGDLPLALREVITAESLGVGSQMEHPAARRMEMLARLRRFAEAGTIAESLEASGFLRSAWVTANPVGDDAEAWAFGSLLASRRWSAASRVLGRGSALRPPAQCRRASDTMWKLGHPERRIEVSDTVLRYALELFAESPLGRCLPALLVPGARDSAAEFGLARPMLAAAESLATRDEGDVAFRLASIALARDSSLAPVLGAPPWYLERLDRLRVDRRFIPRSATLEGDTLTLDWDWRDRRPFVWDEPLLPYLLGFGFRFTQADSGFGAWLQHPYPSHDAPREGPLDALLADLTERYGFAQARGEAAATRVSGAVTDTGLRILVVGGVTQALRRHRPDRVQFITQPCHPDPRAMRDRCRRDVPMVYR